MSEYTQETVRLARKKAKARTDKAQYFLCKVDRSKHNSHFGQPKKSGYYWEVYTDGQVGYKNAEERIPLYPDVVTETREVNWWGA